MSSSETEPESPGTPRKSKKIKRIQRYRVDWEKQFPWLAPDQLQDTKAICKDCNLSLKAEIQVIKVHSSSKRHTSKAKTTSTQSTVNSFFVSQQKISNHDIAVANAELKISGFIAEHNLAFSTADHLIKMLKACITDSNILKDVNLSRTKVTSVIKNVIGVEAKKQLAEKLKKTKFSILTDESTDISSEKTCCIVVRFFDAESQSITSKLWGLVQVFNSDISGENASATAEHLYNLLIKSFNEFNIPMENIIGFGSDGCNIMMGCNNSVASRFKNSHPGIVIMKCVCHSAHLCASEACKKLPRRCEDLARNIYNHFKCSAKRQNSFKEFQIFLNLEIHKILHPSQTRWLSLNEVVIRLIEQWNALKLYFTNSWLGDRTVASEQIFHDLNDPFIKLYFLFLKWILPKFSDFNKYFQTENVVITELHTKIRFLYLELLKYYMNPAYIDRTAISEINPLNEFYFLPKCNMYLEISVMQEISKDEIKGNKELLNDFYMRVQQFLSTACSQVKKRYNFEDELLNKLHYFCPKNAVSNKFRENHPTLLPILQISERFLLTKDDTGYQAIDDQWRSLPSIIENINVDINMEKIDKFWAALLTYKSSLNEEVFRELSDYVLSLLSIPHSNAECERKFSSVNLIKTKLRNKMITATLNGTLLASQHVKDAGSCFKFEPSKNMRLALGQNMYDHKNKVLNSKEVNETEYDDIVIAE